MAQFNNIRSFSTEIDFSAPDKWYMEEFTIGGPLEFTVKDVDKETNSSVYVRLIANGTHIPTFVGMKPRGDSEPFFNSYNKVNIVEFFYDGADVWYVIHNELMPVYASYTEELKPVIRHTGTITQDETWVATVVHIIENDLVIEQGVTVTIEEGATVVTPILDGVASISAGV